MNGSVLTPEASHLKAGGVSPGQTVISRTFGWKDRYTFHGHVVTCVRREIVQKSPVPCSVLSLESSTVIIIIIVIIPLNSLDGEIQELESVIRGNKFVQKISRNIKEIT